jgi:hypothetical protein
MRDLTLLSFVCHYIDTYQHSLLYHFNHQLSDSIYLLSKNTISLNMHAYSFLDILFYFMKKQILITISFSLCRDCFYTFAEEDDCCRGLRAFLSKESASSYSTLSLVSVQFTWNRWWFPSIRLIPKIRNTMCIEKRISYFLEKLLTSLMEAKYVVDLERSIVITKRISTIYFWQLFEIHLD